MPSRTAYKLALVVVFVVLCEVIGGLRRGTGLRVARVGVGLSVVPMLVTLAQISLRLVGHSGRRRTLSLAEVTVSIPITFDRDRARHVLGALLEGRPVQPGPPGKEDGVQGGVVGPVLDPPVPQPLGHGGGPSPTLEG